MSKSAGFAPKNHQKHPKIALKTEKQAIFTAKTPIFWTQTLRPDKMKELNKALHRTAHKAPPVTADVQQMSGGPKNLNALAEG
jgi:hypothetical protein